MRVRQSILLIVLGVLVVGCSGTGPSAAPTADPSRDKLAQVLARGTLVGYAELDYPPQSIRVEGATRKADTKCLANQLTEPEVTGFDIETTKLVATELGVEACFSSPLFSEVTAGSWGDRLDIAYGVRRHQCPPDGSPVDDAAVLLHPPAVHRPRRFAVPGAVRPGRQEDRHLHELHRRGLPPGHARRFRASS